MADSVSMVTASVTLEVTEFAPDDGNAYTKACGGVSEGGFHFVALPVVNPSSGVGPDKPFTQADLIIDVPDFSHATVGIPSAWIDLDAPVDTEEGLALRRASEKAFARETEWCSHLGLHAVKITLPESPEKAVNFARHVNNLALANPFLKIWLETELKEHSLDSVGSDPWCVWNAVQSSIEAIGNVGVALRLTSNLPVDGKVVERWMGEPLRAVVIPQDVFMSNAAGFPALSKAHQKVVGRLYDLDPLVIVRAAGVIDQTGHSHYQQYISYLKSKRVQSEVEELSAPYTDILQAPLQPLRDNLEAHVYNTFQKDPVKYERYETATAAALADRDADTVHTVMVLGAGQGPLVQRALQAAETAGRRIRVFAVEKNPNAYLTLLRRVATEWGDAVEVINSDMRDWKPEHKADIIISELLGSFGDNELSPECLDGAQHLLNEGGISIPYRYRSYLTPVSTIKLHNDIANGNEPKKGFETPFVVKFGNAYMLAPPQECFTFVHPNPEEPIDNTRAGSFTFTAEQDSMIHGFAGYFDAQLYGEIEISIFPPTHSPDMFSWFPIYFPIKTPLHVSAGEEIVISVWRCVDAYKVWYEWSVRLSSGAVTPIHNPGGRSYNIAL